MENSESTSKQSKDNSNVNAVNTENNQEPNNNTSGRVPKNKFEEQGLNEIGDYVGDRQMKKDPEELQHLKEVCAAFFNYKNDSLRDVFRMERDFKSIPEEHKKILKFNYEERIQNIREAIDRNYEFLLKIVSPYSSMFKFYLNEKNEPCVYPLRVLPRNIIKLRSTIKLFIRDWAVEGKEERDSCYKPILEELKRNFPSNKNEKGETRTVLIPGVGLARLLYEAAKLGFEAQGNEFSYFMLFCSNFVLNCVKEKEEFDIQPLIHSFSNVFWKDAPLKKVKIPDENLLEELNKNPEGSMSMVMGEFVEVYKNQLNEWDSIITCFFIDTANNIISYIETIHNILKEGGVWINFGPLLYHYTEIETECSIELSWEEIKLIIIDFGFKITNEEIRECCYSSDIDSMMKSVYKCVFFTAIKQQNSK